MGLSIFNDVQKERGLCPPGQMYTAVNREASNTETGAEKPSPRMQPSGVKKFFFVVDRAFELRSFKYTTDVALRETDL